MSLPSQPQDSPGIRSLRGRVGALALHALYDSRVISAPGREASRVRLNDRLLAVIDEVNPGLPEAERARRLAYARSAHFSSLALKSATARAKRKSRKPIHPRVKAKKGVADAE